MATSGQNRSQHLLYLTDEQLLQGIELMFFAYRGFTSDPDRILEGYDYGRAHHRALHFIKRRQGLTVNELIDVLGVTKQSLNRVLRQLIEGGLVESQTGKQDKRQRNLFLTQEGQALESALSTVQKARVRDAFQAAGPDAVMGFRKVLENMLDERHSVFIHSLKNEHVK